jgi:hypothetical protein
MTKARSNATANAAKGDLTVGTGTNLSGILPVSSQNGDTLVADSSTSTGLRWTKTQPNYANNGAFDWWQRGTSFTVSTSAVYTADRFYCYAAGANATAARSTSVPTGSIAPYSLEFTGATSQTLLEIGQKIESQYVNALKTTVTFSAKVFNNTGAAFTPGIYIQSPTAVDNWAGVTTNVNNVALQSCPDNAWTTIYYTADWSGYTNISNGVGVLLEFGAAANGAAKKIRITEWQVTPTAMIMPFQRSAATIQGELAACQRYFYRHAEGLDKSIMSAGAYDASVVGGTVKFATAMRTAPTLTVPNSAGYFKFFRNSGNVTASTLSLQEATPNAATVFGSFGTSTAGNSGWVTCSNAASYIDFGAEL